MRIFNLIQGVKPCIRFNLLKKKIEERSFIDYGKQSNIGKS